MEYGLSWFDNLILFHFTPHTNKQAHILVPELAIYFASRAGVVCSFFSLFLEQFLKSSYFGFNSILNGRHLLLEEMLHVIHLGKKIIQLVKGYTRNTIEKHVQKLKLCIFYSREKIGSMWTHGPMGDTGVLCPVQGMMGWCLIVSRCKFIILFSLFNIYIYTWILYLTFFFLKVKNVHNTCMHVLEWNRFDSTLFIAFRSI